MAEFKVQCSYFLLHYVVDGAMTEHKIDIAIRYLQELKNTQRALTETSPPRSLHEITTELLKK